MNAVANSRLKHRVRVAISPQTWVDEAVSSSLLLHREYRPQNVLTWGVPSDLFAHARVEWPDRYRWPPQKLWLDPVRDALKKFVPMREVPVRQPSSPVVVFRLWHGRESYDIGVDYSDYTDIDEELAADLLVYFKMQFLADGYGLANVIPGGYPSSRRLYHLLGGARRLRALPARREVYGRFSPNNELRRKAVGLLDSQRRFHYRGGHNLRRYGKNLADAARAGVCVDLPGLGPLCFRLVDYLAMGCCVVTPRPRAIMHVPLQDGVHVVFAKSDLSDLVDQCERMLDDAPLRARLSANAMSFFDRYLESRQLASYYLAAVAARLEQAPNRPGIHPWRAHGHRPAQSA